MELGPFTLMVVVVEVGMDVTMLVEVAQLITEITLPFWSTSVVIIASPAMEAVVVVVVLACVVDVVVDRWIDMIVGRWVGIVVDRWVGG